MIPFTPQKSVTVAATGVSSVTKLEGTGHHLYIVNTGTDPVYFAHGNETVAITTDNGMLIPVNVPVLVNVGTAQYFALQATTTSATVRVTRGSVLQ